MIDNFYDRLIKLKTELINLKTNQGVAADSWVLYKTQKDVEMDVRKTYKITFAPDIATECISRFGLIFQDYEPAPAYIIDFVQTHPSERNVWYVVKIPGAPVYMRPNTLEVIATVPGTIIMEEVA